MVEGGSRRSGRQKSLPVSPQPHPYTRVAQELKGTRFSDVRFVDETESTNADVAALLGNPLALGRTIVAEHQTRGRGRKGRTWISQPGASLMLTTILPIAIDSASLWIVPFWA